MPRFSLLALCLALAGCAAEPPTSSPQVLAAPLLPLPAPLPKFDAEIAALPVRPAGAALAAVSEEHALVRRPSALQPVVAMPAARPIPAPPATAGEPLAARVLAVQAAYRRWCAGDPLPGDGPLLADAGGLRLPDAIACEPPARGQPRRLVPANG